MKPKSEILFLDIETTGLYPILNRVVCIGFRRGDQVETIMDRDEAKMIREFLDKIQPGEEIVGYNVWFDHGFLLVRCLKHGINPAKLIGCEIIDLEQTIEYCMETTRHRVGLQALADFFEIPHEGVSGKLIPAKWEQGDFDFIRRHCIDDLNLIYQIYDRLTPLLFEPATPKQIDLLRKKGVEIKEGLTKAEASELIDQVLRGG